MAMLWSEGLSQEGSKGIAYDKMVGQIDQAFYGVILQISSLRDVDDSEMDDLFDNGR